MRLVFYQALPAGEMAQRLRALAALSGDLGLIPKPKWQLTTIYKLQFQGIQGSLPASVGTRYACGAQTYIQAHSYT